MNRLRLLVVAVACFASTPHALTAPVLKDGKDDKSDLKKLEGEWIIDSWVQLGQPIAIKGTWSFKDEKYSLNQGGALEEGTVKLDKAKKPPIFDLAITAGTCEGKDQPGIYKLDGDTLTLCLAWPGTTDRPADFESTADNRFILIKLKRDKK